jgi:signal transduction histidine kinase
VKDLYRSVIDAIEIAVFVKEESGRFTLEVCPQWLGRLWPEAEAGSSLDVADRFPFLEPFLVEAKEICTGEDSDPVRSGWWMETLDTGREIPLEAAAVRSGDRCVLLIRIPLEEYEEKRRLLQKAREHSLEHGQLRKEIQKKEILLHTIVHDLGGPLTAIRGALRTLFEGDLDAGKREMVEICLRQNRRQEAMIRSILDTFSSEYASRETTTLTPDAAPSARETAVALKRAYLPTFSHAGLSLEIRVEADEGDPLETRIDSTSLLRMLSNLLENALRHSPRNGRVTLAVKRDGDSIHFGVEDEGPGVDEAESAILFEKFGQGEAASGKAGLGLYFCRITTEKWGGTIGQTNLPGKGSRFWFLLPAY